jgi:glycosyltransferase involved in cell wall biosynthesis
MKVSVLTRTFNHERFISQCIESALMQETTLPYEIVVADDASTDGTPSIVRDYASRFPGRVIPILRTRNLGGVENFVSAYHACRGDFVAFLEGDDYWTSPDKLEKQVRYLMERPDCSMCAHAMTVVYADEEREPVDAHPFHKDTATLEELLENDFVYTSAAMLRREIFTDFAPWVYESDVEDFPLWVIAAGRGLIGYLDELLGCYRVHKDGIWSRLDPVRQVEKTIWVYDKINADLNFDYDPILRRMLARFRSQLVCERAGVAPDAVVMVVSEGDSQLLNLYRPAWHFPRKDDGAPGESLADGQEAIGHLEKLRVQGGRYLLVPAVAKDWLARYPAFVRHLEANYQTVWSDEDGMLFDVR